MALVGWVALGAIMGHAAPPADPSQRRANQTFDANVYRVFFTTPSWGDTLSSSSPVSFDLEFTGGFIVDRGLGCNPAGTCYGKEPQFRLDDTGHCHVYVEAEATRTLVAFSASCDPPISINLGAGEYCAYADLTHNDHVARYKPGPQDLPAFDKVCFTVE